MKTMFAIGIAENRNYWLGQDQQTVDGNQIIKAIDDAEAKLTQIQAWLKANPSYQATLGPTDSFTFDKDMARIQDNMPTITSVYGRLSGADSSQWKMTTTEISIYNDFIQSVGDLQGLIAAHAKGMTPSAGANLAATSTTPWLIGGGLVVAGLLVLAAVK
jgi:hypothetical protein